MVSFVPNLRTVFVLGVTAGALNGTVGVHDAGAGSASAVSAEAPFLAENQSAMDKMMAAMTIKPSGDPDKDFSAMMIPHHQGAIDMAEAELLYGHNEQLRRIAQEIIVDQQQEIVAMRLALDQSLPASEPAPDQISGTAELKMQKASR